MSSHLYRTDNWIRAIRVRLARHLGRRGGVQAARPIGGLAMTDEKGDDFKVLCVALGDPTRPMSRRSTRSGPTGSWRSRTSSGPTSCSNPRTSTWSAGAIGTKPAKSWSRTVIEWATTPQESDQVIPDESVLEPDGLQGLRAHRLRR